MCHSENSRRLHERRRHSTVETFALTIAVEGDKPMLDSFVRTVSDANSRFAWISKLGGQKAADPYFGKLTQGGRLAALTESLRSPEYARAVT